MKNMRKITASLLALLALTATLGACASDSGAIDNETPEVGTTSIADITSEAEETAAAIPAPELPDEDFEGHVFNVMLYDANNRLLPNRMYNYFDVEEENGDVLNDAFFTRNANVEERYNIEIIQTPNTSPSATFKKSVLANETVYDAIDSIQSDLYTVTSDGVLINMHELPYVDLDKPYWDRSMAESMTINGKLYYASGDIILMDDTLVVCSIFNKSLWADRGLDDPYMLVHDGQWTLDKIVELSANVKTDLNGDGKMDENDLWGFVSENQGLTNLLHSADEMTVKNDGDSLEIVINSERVISVMGRILEVLHSDDVMIPESDLAHVSDLWPTVSSMFQADQILIRTTTFEPIPRDLRAMDTDFGILPIPKYEESTDGYRATVTQNFGVIGVPSNAPDLDRTGVILEALAYESVTTVSPAFYDKSLDGKVMRDDDSREMLDIIFGNKVYDIGTMFNIGSLREMMNDQVKNGANTLVSKLEANMSVAENDIQKIYENFSK